MRRHRLGLLALALLGLAATTPVTATTATTGITAVAVRLLIKPRRGDGPGVGGCRHERPDVAACGIMDAEFTLIWEQHAYMRLRLRLHLHRVPCTVYRVPKAISIGREFRNHDFCQVVVYMEGRGGSGGGGGVAATANATALCLANRRWVNGWPIADSIHEHVE